jgi:alpha-tubulin suppressor-like RCC1 family protein
MLLVTACSLLNDFAPLPEASSAGGAAAASGAGGGPCDPAKCPDPGDCVTAICAADGCHATSDPAGTACKTGGKVCDGIGQCVECLTERDCTDAAKPVCTESACVAATCVDGKPGGDESDVDCGGSCPPCPNDKACKQVADCASGYCEDGAVCKACTRSEQCSIDKWCDALVAGGKCVPDLAQGQACTEVAQCPAGACVDGFCCDEDCDGTCRACSNDKTGQPDAVCANVPVSTDPDNECPGLLCNGSGACCGGAVEVALGGYHGCARKQDATLWCWGHNFYGQLGDGSTAEKSSPVQVSKLGAPAVEVALGGYHSCAGKQDATLWCWGRNEYGQLGDGSTVQKPSPVQVSALGTAAVEVALGLYHSCARKQDGTLWCWGRNGSGQLGDGTTVQKSSPVQVSALGPVAVEVALGADHSCARKQDGTLWCWGYNGSGQLGDGTTVNKSSPVQVSALGTAVVEVALGVAHSCARKQDGTLWCWGNNGSGELGDGSTVNKPSPVQVSALGTAAVEVALGADHSCARKQDGTLWCWGDNFYGQLGDGTTANKLSPVEVTALGTTVIEVALGSAHSCARKQDGTLWCWGNNGSGQLGDGTTVNKPLPVQVPPCP